MSQGAKTRLTLVGKDAAEQDRQRFLDDLPGPAMVVCLAIGLTALAGAALYVGVLVVLQAAHWIAWVVQ
jgi:hypothetical protein